MHSTVVYCLKISEGYIKADLLCIQFRALTCKCDFKGIERNIPQRHIHFMDAHWALQQEAESSCAEQGDTWMTKQPHCLSTYLKHYPGELKRATIGKDLIKICMLRPKLKMT